MGLSTPPEPVTVERTEPRSGELRGRSLLRPRALFLRHSVCNRGGDRVVLEYANYLAERGYVVCLAVNEIETRFRIDSRVQVVRIPWKGKAGTVLFGLLRRPASDVVIVDIVHLTMPLAWFTRLVYLAQADDTMYYRPRFLRVVISALYRAFFRWTRSTTLCVSAALTETLTRRYRASRISTVENGIDLAQFSDRRDPTLVASKGDRLVVLVLAREDRFRKGGDLCEAAINALAKRSALPPWEVWIIGSAPLAFDASVKSRRLGSPSDAELCAILSSADVLLYPSRHEGFGLFPLEAMACGCTVVTTRAVPYAVDRENGLVVDVDDSAGLEERLVEVLTHDQLRTGLKERGKVFARRFDVAESRRLFERELIKVCS